MSNFHTYTIKQTAEKLNSNISKGLSTKQRNKLLDEYGANVLPKAPSQSMLVSFLLQFKNFMILILLIAAGLSLFASYLEGKPDFVEPGIILSILILNAFLGTVQEVRAQKALEALKSRQPHNATIITDGNAEKVNCESLVPGDLLELRQGLIVPADARIVSCTNLIVDESALTGESKPVSKNPELKFKPETSLGDRKNMVYSSTIISSGHGLAMITETGRNTEIGKIADMLGKDKAPETPLMLRMNTVSKVLGLSCIGICAVIFLIGIYNNTPLLTMFLTSISLAVASIPEGLPAVVTIMLSIGVLRLASRRAIMRNLAAVETLGKTGVICSDKTGTLTMNKMTLVGYATPNGRSNLSSLSAKSFEKISAENNGALSELLASAKINCTATKNSGDATERAIITAAESISLPDYKKLEEIPFNSKRKTMVTITATENIITIYIKGAYDRVLPFCTNVNKALIDKCHNSFTSEALRVLAVAKRDISKEEYERIKVSCKKGDATEYEERLYSSVTKDFTFLGLLAFLDPPRPEVKSAIQKAKRAGIRTVMITGDHSDTAKAIGRKIGIPADYAITGEELDKISDDELINITETTSIFARVSPSHKVRLVKAFQSQGHRVVMTGDGINDAPALKVADIGAAMGQTGTDVAKEASDMILTDDNYATIVEAVAGGRGIYDNIKKSIHFLLSCNTGEILTVLFALIFGLKSPLAAIQLLWINLITDSLPAIALGMDKPNKKVLNHSSYYQREGMFDLVMVIRIILEGSLIACISLIAYQCYGCTGCFVVLGMSELLHSFNLRSTGSVFAPGTRNPFVLLSFIVCSILQLGVVISPKLSAVFGLNALSLPALITLLLMSLSIIVVSEIEKLTFSS